MKKMLLFSLALLFVFSAVMAFASGEQEKEIEEIELRFSWWGSEQRHRATLEAFKLFEQENPNIKMKGEYSGFDGYKDKLTAQIAGGEAPDIFTEGWFMTHVKANALLELNDLVNFSGHNQDIVKGLTVNGKIYAVPIGVAMTAYGFNKTQMEKYGIEPPKDPYTWDDMAEKFKEISIKSNGKLYGAIDASVSFEVLSVFGFGYTKLGAKAPFPNDNEKLTFTEDQIRAYYQYWSDLRAANAVAPPEISVMSDQSSNNLIVKGIAAFSPIYAGLYPRFQSMTKDELDMMLTPVGPKGETGDLAISSPKAAIYKMTKYPQEAAQFLNFFTQSPEAAKVLKICRGVLPTEVQRRALLSEKGLLSDIELRVIQITNDGLKRPLKQYYDGPLGTYEIWGYKNLLERIGQEIAFGKISVEEGARKFVVEANRIIEANK